MNLTNRRLCVLLGLGAGVSTWCCAGRSRHGDEPTTTPTFKSVVTRDLWIAAPDSSRGSMRLFYEPGSKAPMLAMSSSADARDDGWVLRADGTQSSLEYAQGGAVLSASTTGSLLTTRRDARRVSLSIDGGEARIECADHLGTAYRVEPNGVATRRK